MSQAVQVLRGAIETAQRRAFAKWCRVAHSGRRAIMRTVLESGPCSLVLCGRDI